MAYLFNSMKIAFCFLIKNKIGYEDIWFEYLKNSIDIEIIIHCVENHDLKLISSLTNNIYVNQVPSSWGKLLHVENFLIEKSKELGCDKCIFLSDSCLPVKPLSYVKEFLLIDKSFISNRKPWEFSRFPPEVKKFEFLMGNHQWVIIDKKHYDLFLNSNLRQIFENHVFFPEESYYATILQASGINDQENVENITTTYVDWDRPTNYNRSPYVFNLSDADLLDLEKVSSHSQYLFMRKIADNGQTSFINTLKLAIL